MAAPKGARTVGAVAIRAIPDVSGFNSELVRKLKALPETTVVIEAELSKVSIQKIKQQIRSLADTIQVKINPELDRAQMKRVMDELGQTRKVDAEVGFKESPQSKAAQDRAITGFKKQIEQAVEDARSDVNFLGEGLTPDELEKVRQGLERTIQRIQDKAYVNYRVNIDEDDVDRITRKFRQTADSVRDLAHENEGMYWEAARSAEELTRRNRELAQQSKEAAAAKDRQEREDAAKLKRSEEAVRQAVGRLRQLQTDSIRQFERDISRDVQIDDRYINSVKDKFEDSLERMRADLNLKFEVELPREEMLEIEHQFNKFIHDMNGKNVRIDADANTFFASRMIQWLTRPRFVEIFARMNKKSVVSAATTIAALSGGRLIGEMGSDVWDFFKNLDKNLPSVTAMTVAITGLSGAMFGLLSQFVSIGAGFAQMGPLFLTLPGFLMGSIAAIAGLVIAWKDAGTELADLKQPFRDLQDVMSSSYWREAREPIRELVTGLMPQMERALGRASGALGSFTGALADSFANELADGRFESIFETFSEGFEVLEEGTDGFAGAIVSMAQIAGRYWPRLAGWITETANTFDGWLKDISEDGRLDAWMETAIQALKDFGAGLHAAGSILSGFWRAAENAGATGMAGFRETMEDWDKLINSPDSQTALTHFFAGGRAALEGIGNAIEHIFGGLSAVGPEVERAFAGAGGAVEEFGRLLGGVFSEGAFVSGLADAMESFKQSFQDFAPAVEPLSNMLGDTARFIGEMGEAFSGPLSAAVIALEGPLTRILDALKPLMGTLADELERIIASDQVKSILDDLATTIEGVVTAINERLPELQPVIDAFLNAFEALADQLPDLVPILEDILDILIALEPLLTAIGKALEWTLIMVSGAIQSTVELIRGSLATINTFMDGIFEAIGRIGAAFQGLMSGELNFGEFLSEVDRAWDGLIESTEEAASEWEQTLENLSGIGQEAAADILRMFGDDFGADLLERLGAAFDPAQVEDILQTFAAILATQGSAAAREYMDGILAGLPDAAEAGVQLGRSVSNGAATVEEEGKEKGRLFVNRLTAEIDAGKAGAEAAAFRVSEGVKLGVAGLSAAGSREGKAFGDGLSNSVAGGQQQAKVAAAALRGAAVSGLGGMYSDGSRVGASLGDGIKAGIESKVSAIAAAAASAVKSATNAAKAAANIQSPSRVWRDEIGAQLMAGGAKGIDDNAWRMQSAAGRAMPSVPRIDWSGSPLDRAGSGDSPLVGSLTVQSHGDTRADMDDVMFRLRTIKRGGR